MNEEIKNTETEMKKEHYITKENWDALHPDYKSVINGTYYVLMMTEKGTSLVPVKIEGGSK